MTGYEVQACQAIVQIAKELKRIADALDRMNKYQEEAVDDVKQTILASLADDDSDPH